MNFSKNQIFIVGGGAAAVLIIVLILLGVIPGLKPKPPTVQNGALTVWGIGDTTAAYQSAIAAFTGAYSGVSVTYRGFPDETQYDAALLDALAAGQGPDIFEVKNTGLAKAKNKLVPLPATSLTQAQLGGLFPDTVVRDFSDAAGVYALPLSIDTLALVYNQALLNQGGVAVPPATWNDVLADIPKLSKIDQSGRISQSAVALGSGSNVAHAADILSLLMLQNGVQMLSNDRSAATFGSDAGQKALTFYTDFSNTGSSAYTWNAGMPGSEDAFLQGTAAMVLDYQSMLAKTAAENKFLQVGVAPVPQVKNASSSVAFPNYWGYGVSRQSKNASLAWGFVLALTTNQTNAAAYLAATGRPPALRTLIAKSSNDPVLGVFGAQALIARAWAEPDPAAVDQIFTDMITGVAQNQLSVTNALARAAGQVNQLLAAQP